MRRATCARVSSTYSDLEADFSRREIITDTSIDTCCAFRENADDSRQPDGFPLHAADQLQLLFRL